MLRDDRITRLDGSPLRDGERAEHGDILVDGEPLDAAPGVVVMLHKPVGYVCSTTDLNPLVYDLLPPRFRDRIPIIAPIGRLDRDTSGLLLLTDDGQINHRLTSPKSQFPKVYEATLAQDLRGVEAAVFAAGDLMLEGETRPLLPAILEVLDARHARVTLMEGRYHQVRRMFAAFGNHVESLHRAAVGPLSLDTLESGDWRVLSAVETSGLR
ncbi:MAG: 16S rRNA pseudouridine(516) synthase [Longimicrobiales bacterium]